MAEVASVNLEAILAKTTNTKHFLFTCTPASTSDTFTWDSSTVFNQTGGGYSKILVAWAQDSSTGMPKAISSNGSTIFTTRGWTTGDNKWFVHVVAINNLGE